jgi:hypothetical protein
MEKGFYSTSRLRYGKKTNILSLKLNKNWEIYKITNFFKNI